MIKICLNNQLEELAPAIDASMLDYLQTQQINKFESYEEIDLISFDWYNIQDVMMEPASILIVLTKKDLFFLCEGEPCLNLVKKLVYQDKPNEKALYGFFSALIKGDLNYLEVFEERITQIEDDLLKGMKRECSEEIIKFRRELLKLKKYYEELNEIFEDLIEDEYHNNLISKEELRYYKNLHNKIDRFIAYVHNLRDYVTQVREAYQAQIDIEQNKLMKIFTVITAIFLPLTLIVGWYGMNLQMPEFSWEFAYPFVILLSLTIVVLCIIIFKRKQWF